MRVPERTPRRDNQMLLRKQQKDSCRTALKPLSWDHPRIFIGDIGAGAPDTSGCTHSEHSLRFCSFGTTLGAKFSISRGSTRGRAGTIHVCMCIHTKPLEGAYANAGAG